MSRNYGWAAHLFEPSGKRVTFADLESEFGIPDVFRAQYRTMNHAVHAGPASTLSHTDFGMSYFNQTRPHIDQEELRTVADSIVYFVARASETAGRQLASELDAYDDLLLLGNMRAIETRRRRKRRRGNL